MNNVYVIVAKEFDRDEDKFIDEVGDFCFGFTVTSYYYRPATMWEPEEGDTDFQWVCCGGDRIPSFLEEGYKLFDEDGNEIKDLDDYLEQAVDSVDWESAMDDYFDSLEPYFDTDDREF